jgi:hypothetical protein
MGFWKRFGRQQADLTGASAGTSQELQAILERLDRIAVALEKIAESGLSAVGQRAPISDLSDVKAAILEGRWEDATSLLDLNADHSEASRLAGLLADRKKTASEDLLARLKAAQDVTDPNMVLDIRDQMVAVISIEERNELDARLAKWFMPLMMKRLRTGIVGPEVPELATKFAERFSHTMEGASIRASLPTLRRAAGLCPKCSKPYRGIADACPVCVAGPPITLALPDTDEEAEEVEKLTRPEESLFVNLDE